MLFGELEEVDGDSCVPALLPSVERLVNQLLEAVRSSAADAWPPVKDITEERGCVGITEMLYDTAKENVTSAVGTLSNDQDKCLKDMVRSIAEQGSKSWKKASLKPDEGIDEFKQGGTSTKMAPLTKRGMAQPSSGNRKKKL